MPKENELDQITVYNPDSDCNEEDTEEGWLHSDYFQVKWGGKPHRITPGQTRIMPRFLAEHFAKHLANHLLMKMELETNKKGLIQSPVERPKMLKKILIKVESYFEQVDEVDAGNKVFKEVEELNKEKVLDVGEVPNPTIGALKSEPKSLEEIIKVAGEETKEETKKENKEEKETEEKVKERTSIWDSTKEKPTRKELFKVCDEQGIECTGRETVDQLIDKLKKF